MIKKILLILVMLSLSVSVVSAQNISDVILTLRAYLTSNTTLEKNNDNLINIVDVAHALRVGVNPTNTPPPFPTGNPAPVSTTWYQDFGNGQRTSYVSTDPQTPFSVAWSWNGGPRSQHKYTATREGRIIVGNGKLYAPAGNQGIYGVNLANGSQAWNARPGGSFNASPAYDPSSNTVLAGSSNGNVYKLDAVTGNVTGTYSAGSSVEDAILIVGNFAYAVTQSGQLHKFNIGNMSQSWIYTGGSRGLTPAAYSTRNDLVIFGTLDLKLHAINNSNGQARWAKNSTGLTAGNNTSFEFSYPAVADAHNLVLIPIQLRYSTMTDCQNGQFAGTPADVQRNMNNDCQALIAINMDTGDQAFKTAVGSTSVEDYVPNRAANETTVNYTSNGYGAQLNTYPVIKSKSNTEQVAYTVARSGQNLSCDWRNTGVVAELILSGGSAGQFKFVRMTRTGDNSWCGKANVSCSNCLGMSFVHIADEGGPISMAGNLMFVNHWSAAIGARITGSGSGNSFTDPLITQDMIFVGRAAKGNCSGHTMSGDYAYATEQGKYTQYKSLPGGFWTNYCGEVDPPGFATNQGDVAGLSYSTGTQGRFTMIAEGYMFFQGNGGDVLAIKHN